MTVMALYINLSKLISPINLFHHYRGHNSYLYPVAGYPFGDGETTGFSVNSFMNQYC